MVFSLPGKIYTCLTLDNHQFSIKMRWLWWRDILNFCHKCFFFIGALTIFDSYCLQVTVKIN